MVVKLDVRKQQAKWQIFGCLFNKGLHSCKYINIIFVGQIFVAKQKNVNIKRMVVSSRLKECYSTVIIVWTLKKRNAQHPHFHQNICTSNLAINVS